MVPGVNGQIAASGAPEDLAEAIVAVLEAGAALRTSTAAWFGEHADELSVARSLRQVVAGYERASERVVEQADRLPSAP